MELILTILFILVYFLPALIAGNKHPQATAITVLNLFLGWTFIGWLVALIWACTKPEPKQVIIPDSQEKSSSIDDLEKLAELKEKGIITEEEFEKKKAQILGL